MNTLDRRIEELANELFTKQGLSSSLITFKVKELKICVERGYNSRTEIISLLTKAVI